MVTASLTDVWLQMNNWGGGKGMFYAMGPFGGILPFTF